MTHGPSWYTSMGNRNTHGRQQGTFSRPLGASHGESARELTLQRTLRCTAICKDCVRVLPLGGWPHDCGSWRHVQSNRKEKCRHPRAEP